MTQGTFPHVGSFTRRIGWWRIRYNHEDNCVELRQVGVKRRVVVPRWAWALECRRQGNIAAAAIALWRHA